MLTIEPGATGAVPLAADTTVASGVSTRGTSRIRSLSVSEIRRSPALSTATPCGWPSSAPMAGPPSPEYPYVPFPATVVMAPAALTMRIALLAESAMKRSPALSTATAAGKYSPALVAGPPSPKYPPPPPPAIMVMVPAGLTLRIREFHQSAMNRLPAPSTAIPCGWSSLPLMAGPPSPEYPATPLPATVVMAPAGFTMRIRLLPASAMKRLPALSTATP
jgi:hypothetical protein